MIFKRKNTLRELVDEVTQLRARKVEYTVLIEIKDTAFQEYVNERVKQINFAIRATNGPKRGETEQSYRNRLLAANAA